jgi:2-aminoadipate transaminase
VAAISFARGYPGPDLLPIEDFGACAVAALGRDGATALNYGPPSGYPPLRAWIADRHGVDPKRVVTTTGSLQGFSFVARHFAALGSTFLVDGPCYDRSLSILRRLGADILQVPLRNDGLDVDALADALATADGPKVVYTIPTFQNPSGHTLGIDGRRRVLELAREHEAVVLEDDPYGLLRFEGDPVPTLFELSDDRGVLFLTSFSKTVAPGIRAGYVILPDELVTTIEGYVLENYVSPTIFVQAALHEFLASGRFEPNLDRVRAGLRERRDAMLEALEREFPDGAAWNRPQGGYFLWLDLPGGVRAESLHAQAAELEVAFIKGADFYVGEGGEEAARLAFSFERPDAIAEGVARLGRLVREAAAVAA